MKQTQLEAVAQQCCMQHSTV